MSVSRWSRASQGTLQMTATLPAVPAKHRSIELSRDGATIHVRAARPIPPQGARCLPRDAQLSQDGRFELFQADVAVPGGADGGRAVLRRLADGLAVTVPLRHSSPAPRAEAVPSELQTASAPRAEAPAPGPRQPRRWTPVQPPPAAQAPSPASRQPRRAAPMPPQGAAQALRGPSAGELARAQGVDLVEEEFPWPEKSADAVAGWRDNRGDFHEY